MTQPVQLSTPTNAPSMASNTPWSVILAASAGNALEWYDLVIYGFFATTLARLFFPLHDSSVSLLLALGTFGLSYLIRPVGALVLGSYADRAGRKASMLLSLALMMLGTLLIGIMPTYASIGIFAPCGILLSRLIQGFSVGGIFGSSTALLVEHAPNRRGFMSSWQYASQGATTLLASAVGALLTSQLSVAQIESWGWRLPFILGLLVGPVGFYIRRHVEEGAAFVKPPKSRGKKHAPISLLLKNQKQQLLLAMGILVVSTAVNYLTMYMPTYAIRQLHLPASIGFTATLLAGVLLTVMPPFIGIWSDRIGRLGIMQAACVVTALSIYPAFLIMTHYPSFGALMAVLAWISLLKGCYVGGMSALLSEIFPTATRASGLSLSYNISTSLFGGFTPLLIATLIQTTGSPVSPAFFIVFCALISLLSLSVLARRQHLSQG
jgi:MHS family proline/betaine transporter-like MFS transporter